MRAKYKKIYYISFDGGKTLGRKIEAKNYLQALGKIYDDVTDAGCLTLNIKVMKIEKELLAVCG